MQDSQAFHVRLRPTKHMLLLPLLRSSLFFLHNNRTMGRADSCKGATEVGGSRAGQCLFLSNERQKPSGVCMHARK